jgi:hypothetical protein
MMVIRASLPSGRESNDVVTYFALPGASGALDDVAEVRRAEFAKGR